MLIYRDFRPRSFNFGIIFLKKKEKKTQFVKHFRRKKKFCFIILIDSPIETSMCFPHKDV